MLDDTPRGRHRSATRYNPAAELSTIVKSAGQTSVKASAVLAASGGLVAAFALPAQATGASVKAATASSTGAAQTRPVAEPAALPLAAAVVAPATASPVAVETLGVVGVKAVAKPKPRPRPVAAPAPEVREAVARRDTSTTSRSTTRPTAPTTVKQSSSEIVNIARTLLGIPYLWGGTTPAGFDCSGFSQYVFAKAGISIPRTASEQQRAATPVSNPQPGDLVFFGYPAWHMGIYTGNGMMIDSPRAGKVTSERPIFSGVSGYGPF